MSPGVETPGSAGGGSSSEDSSAVAVAVKFPSSEEELSAECGSEDEVLLRGTENLASPVSSKLGNLDRFTFFLE